MKTITKVKNKSVKSKNYTLQQRVYNTIADIHPNWDEKQIKKWMDEYIVIT